MSSEPLRAEPLVTARLELTPVRVADAAEMALVLGDPRLHDFIGGQPLGQADLEDRYRRWAAGSPRPDESWLNWVVRIRPGGAAAGTVQATARAGRAEVAWVVGIPWQGRGYAAEAARAVTNWLAAAGRTRITAKIAPGHLASEGTARRAGFSLTAGTAEGERVWRWAPETGREPGLS